MAYKLLISLEPGIWLLNEPNYKNYEDAQKDAVGLLQTEPKYLRVKIIKEEPFHINIG